MKRLLAAFTLAAATCLTAQAAPVLIDLSGAASGTTVTGTNASFAQSFAGQTVSGTALLGSPTNPLMLQAAGSIAVAFFDPGVSAASNSLLSPPDNQGPLAILLGSNADAFNWTMGSGDGGSVLASLYGLDGALVGSTSIAIGSGYNLFSLNGFGTFRGITFSANSDELGVRFQNMSFNAVNGVSVPEPGALALVALALLAAGAARRRTLTAARRRG